MSLPFVRSTVLKMEGYTPGEQPRAGQRVIKLNTNENPFPPSPKVMQAIRSLEADCLRRYPDPDSTLFREAAAKLLNVTPKMVVTGNGSDDVLAFAMQTFLAPGDLLAFPDPTYSLYPVLAQLAEVRCVGVPWEKDWDLPIDALLDAKANAIFLANPNAPSGTFVPVAKIDELAEQFDGLLLIDEAYVDFAEGSCIELVMKYDNVVVTRTLSKAYSLAGLRFGYAVAQEQVVAQMAKAKDSYPCDALSIVAATAAIMDQEYARQSWEYVKSERLRVSNELAALGWQVLPSQANFILATVPDNKAGDFYRTLKQQGILVRYFDKPGLSDKLRITIGTKEENEQLLAAIKK